MGAVTCILCSPLCIQNYAEISLTQVIILHAHDCIPALHQVCEVSLHVQVGAVTCVDFSPLYPYNYAVTSSTRVIIFDAHTRRPLTTLSRFKDKAYSGTFRNDGKLLVAGGETGFVQVRPLFNGVKALLGVLSTAYLMGCDAWTST